MLRPKVRPATANSRAAAAAAAHGFLASDHPLHANFVGQQVGLQPRQLQALQGQAVGHARS